MIIVRNIKSTQDILLILNRRDRKREETSLSTEEMASHLEDKTFSLK
jgi:hypothetical protein